MKIKNTDMASSNGSDQPTVSANNGGGAKARSEASASIQATSDHPDAPKDLEMAEPKLTRKSIQDNNKSALDDQIVAAHCGSGPAASTKVAKMPHKSFSKSSPDKDTKTMVATPVSAQKPKPTAITVRTSPRLKVSDSVSAAPVPGAPTLNDSLSHQHPNVVPPPKGAISPSEIKEETDVLLQFSMQKTGFLDALGGRDTVYDTVLQEWWPVYEQANHNQKRKVTEACIRNMDQRGVRFLSRLPSSRKVNAGRYFMVEKNPEENPRISNKVLRALRQQVQSHTSHLTKDELEKREELFKEARDAKFASEKFNWKFHRLEQCGFLKPSVTRDSHPTMNFEALQQELDQAKSKLQLVDQENCKKDLKASSSPEYIDPKQSVLRASKNPVEKLIERHQARRDRMTVAANNSPESEQLHDLVYAALMAEEQALLADDVSNPGNDAEAQLDLKTSESPMVNDSKPAAKVTDPGNIAAKSSCFPLPKLDGPGRSDQQMTANDDFSAPKSSPKHNNTKVETAPVPPMRMEGSVAAGLAHHKQQQEQPAMTPFKKEQSGDFEPLPAYPPVRMQSLGSVGSLIDNLVDDDVLPPLVPTAVNWGTSRTSDFMVLHDNFEPSGEASAFNQHQQQTNAVSPDTILLPPPLLMRQSSTMVHFANMFNGTSSNNDAEDHFEECAAPALKFEPSVDLAKVFDIFDEPSKKEEAMVEVDGGDNYDDEARALPPLLFAQTSTFDVNTPLASSFGGKTGLKPRVSRNDPLFSGTMEEGHKALTTFVPNPFLQLPDSSAEVVSKPKPRKNCVDYHVDSNSSPCQRGAADAVPLPPLAEVENPPCQVSKDDEPPAKRTRSHSRDRASPSVAKKSKVKEAESPDDLRKKLDLLNADLEQGEEQAKAMMHRNDDLWKKLVKSKPSLRHGRYVRRVGTSKRTQEIKDSIP